MEACYFSNIILCYFIDAEEESLQPTWFGGYEEGLETYDSSEYGSGWTREDDWVPLQ